MPHLRDKRIPTVPRLKARLGAFWGTIHFLVTLPRVGNITATILLMKKLRLGEVETFVQVAQHAEGKARAGDVSRGCPRKGMA